MALSKLDLLMMGKGNIVDRLKSTERSIKTQGIGYTDEKDTDETLMTVGQSSQLTTEGQGSDAGTSDSSDPLRPNLFQNCGFESFDNGATTPALWTPSGTAVLDDGQDAITGTHVVQLTSGASVAQQAPLNADMPDCSIVVSVFARVLSGGAEGQTVVITAAHTPGVESGDYGRHHWAGGEEATNELPADGEWYRVVRSFVLVGGAPLTVTIAQGGTAGTIEIDAAKLETASANGQDVGFLQPTPFSGADWGIAAHLRSLSADNIIAGTLTVGGSLSTNPTITVLDTDDSEMIKLGPNGGTDAGITVFAPLTTYATNRSYKFRRADGVWLGGLDAYTTSDGFNNNARLSVQPMGTGASSLYLQAIAHSDTRSGFVSITATGFDSAASSSKQAYIILEGKNSSTTSIELSAEAMRLKGGGVLVGFDTLGLTPPDGTVLLKSTGGSKTFLTINDTAASSDTLLYLNGASIASASYFIRSQLNGTTDKFFVRGDGLVYGVQAVFGAAATTTTRASVFIYDNVNNYGLRVGGSTAGGANIQGILTATTGFDRVWFGHNAVWDEGDDLWHIDSVGANDTSGILIENGGSFQFIISPSTGSTARTLTHANLVAASKMSLSTTGVLTAANQIVSSSTGIKTAGTNAGLIFVDRTSSQNWQWYGSGGTARLHNGTQDVVNVNAAGTFMSYVESNWTTGQQNAAQFFNRSTGTPAAGGGTNYLYYLDSATVADRNAFTLQILWGTATDASRASKANFYVYDATTNRLALSIDSSGTAARIGFLGATPAIRQAVTALTASVGTASDTIPDVGASFNQTTLNNIIRSLVTKINAHRTALVNLGLES